ncbi:uncharacterized protein LOC125309770 [Alosa alosa]|uniref:uncharacterized protein LOC125309770 n=1 Tax=Alosa alosa TaxID=278164 RepID=UPI0020151594|nr:uncharacterized protein LOC125309770 [Alosa alosa]
MTKTCCVWGCAARYTKGVGFYRFPSGKTKLIQRNLWVRRLKRVDAVTEKIARLPGGGVATSNGRDWEPNIHHRVCGRHFLTGCPNPDPDHPDFAPSQHLGPELADPTASAKRAADNQGRYHRAVRRRLPYSAAGPGPEPEIVPDIEDNQEEEGDNQDHGEQCHLCEMLQQEVHRLRLERDSYKDKLSKLSISSEHFIVTENDAASQIKCKRKFFSFYFGLPSFAVFIWILNLIAPLISERRVISKENQLLLTLMKLRHGLAHVDLGFRFGVSSACVSNVMSFSLTGHSISGLEPRPGRIINTIILLRL